VGHLQHLARECAGLIAWGPRTFPASQTSMHWDQAQMLTYSGKVSCQLADLGAQLRESF